MSIIVDEHTLTTDKITQEKISVAIGADAHGDKDALGELKKELDKREDKIQALLCPGDMFDIAEEIDPVLEWFSRLKILVFLSGGNHEEEIEQEKMEEAYRKLEKMSHVTVLRESYKPVELKGTNIRISSLNLPACYQGLYNKDKTVYENYANSIYQNTLDKNYYNINLSHLPGYILDGQFSKRIKATNDIDLFASGHMHNGIIRLPNHRGLLGPYASILPKDSYGEYIEEDKTAIITGGLTPFAKSIEIRPLRLLNKALRRRMDVVNIERKEPAH